MDSSEGLGVRRSRRSILPPTSTRTLHHPSFMPLSAAAGRHHPQCCDQTVHPITPAEVFYSDPTMTGGSRIPNHVDELRVFQLNTPPPVMSACPAPPSRPDPFRSGLNPTSDLGSLTIITNPRRPPAQPNRVIIQLTQEEDQAITTLLKLHYHESTCEQETLGGPQTDQDSNQLFSDRKSVDSTSAEDIHKTLCSDEQSPGEVAVRGHLQQGRCWSDTELEAANTLLSGFSLMEDNKVWVQNHNESAVTFPESLPSQCPGSASVSADCTQRNIGYINLTCIWDSGLPDWGDFGTVEAKNASDTLLPVHEERFRLPPPSPDPESKSRSSVFEDFSAMKQRMLSDSEGDALHVLLNLGNIGALGSEQ